jgi:hypothetical protein
MSHSALTGGRSIKAAARSAKAVGAILGTITVITALSVGASHARPGAATRTPHAVIADSAPGSPAATPVPPAPDGPPWGPL